LITEKNKGRQFFSPPRAANTRQFFSPPWAENAIIATPLHVAFKRWQLHQLSAETFAHTIFSTVLAILFGLKILASQFTVCLL